MTDNNLEKKTVCVLGLGFVGSAMSLAIANAESNKKKLYNVIGIDLPNERGEKIVSDLNMGKFPFENNDNHLIQAMEEVYKEGNLFATTDNSLLRKADVVLIDINLDITYDENLNPKLELKDFNEAVTLVGKMIKKDTLIIIETTVPPGTCEHIVKPIIKKEFINKGFTTDPLIAHSYERVMPGKNYYDSIINYWRVYSGVDEKSSKLCKEFLETVISTDDFPLTKLSSTTASETAKVLENSYRALNIAFIDEWGRFAENTGVDLFEVINAIRLRPTHSNMMKPGFGVGGYCLTKDPFFAQLSADIIFKLPHLKFPFSFEAVKTNNKMPLESLKKIKNTLKDLKNKKVLLLGVSYREDVGDTRYSPSEIFAVEAEKMGASLVFSDPFVKYWKEMELNVSQKLPIPQEFDVIVFAVNHKEYKKINFKKWLVGNKKTLIFDANNVLTNDQIQDIVEKGYIFDSIGRGEFKKGNIK